MSFPFVAKESSLLPGLRQFVATAPVAPHYKYAIVRRKYVQYGVRLNASSGGGPRPKRYDTKRERPVISMIFGGGKTPTREYLVDVLRSIPLDQPEDVFKIVEQAEMRDIDLGPLGMSYMMKSLRAYANKGGGGSTENAVAIMERQLQLNPALVSPFYVAMVANICLIDKQYDSVENLFKYSMKRFGRPHRLMYGYMLHVAFRRQNHVSAYKIWSLAYLDKVRLRPGPLAAFLSIYSSARGPKAASKVLLNNVITTSPSMFVVFVRHAIRIFYEMEDLMGLMEFVHLSHVYECRPHLSYVKALRYWLLMAYGIVPTPKRVKEFNPLVEHSITVEDLAKEAIARNRFDILEDMMYESTNLGHTLSSAILAKVIRILSKKSSHQAATIIERALVNLRLRTNSTETFRLLWEAEAYRDVMLHPPGSDYAEILRQAKNGVKVEPPNMNEPTNPLEPTLPASHGALIKQLIHKRPRTRIRAELKAAGALTVDGEEIDQEENVVRIEGEELEAGQPNVPTRKTYSLLPSHGVAALERVLFEKGLNATLSFFTESIPSELKGSPEICQVLMGALNASLRFKEAESVAQNCITSGNITTEFVNCLIECWSHTKGLDGALAAADLIPQHQLELSPSTFKVLFDACRIHGDPNIANKVWSSLVQDGALPPPTFSPACGAYVKHLVQIGNQDGALDIFWMTIRAPSPNKWLTHHLVEPLVSGIFVPRLTDSLKIQHLSSIVASIAPNPDGWVDWQQLEYLCNIANEVGVRLGRPQQTLPVRPSKVLASFSEEELRGITDEDAEREEDTDQVPSENAQTSSSRQTVTAM